MNDIIEPAIDYDFSKLYLGPPSTLAGGSYFTRIMYNNNKILHFQTPKCLTKQGFVKSGKKYFVDLMFDNNDTVLINWIENLETKCQELLYNKGESWFQTKLEKDDIETAFTSAFKLYKSGKYYLLRVNVKPNIKVYNESDEIIKIEDITTSNYIISILEIQGIKFTSRNFQIEIEMKQSMIVSPDPFLDECFIKKPGKSVKQVSISDSTPSVNANTLNTSIDLDSFIEETVNDLTNTNILKPNNLEITNKPKTDNIILKESNDVTDVSHVANVSHVADVSNENVEDKYELSKHTNGHDNIILEIEDLDFSETEDPNILKEVDLSSSLVNSLETITLKKPNQVHYENYKLARDRAKKAKEIAIAAYLEAKNIKNTYLLDDSDDSNSDDSDFENFDE
jgi:hypothetical protein